MFVILINREPRNHIIKFASFMLIPYYKYNLCNLTSPSQPQSKSSYGITLFYHNHHLVVAQNVYIVKTYYYSCSAVNFKMYVMAFLKQYNEII